jgi:hypothetical protein
MHACICAGAAVNCFRGKLTKLRRHAPRVKPGLHKAGHRYMPFVRHYLFAILFTFICTVNAIAQKKDSFVVRTHFASQGEQEDYWSEKLFHEEYNEQHYARFMGNIDVIGISHIRFGSIILHADVAPEFKCIFSLGILYPQLITEYSVYPRESSGELSKMADGQRVINNMILNDTLSIGNLEELKFLSTDPTKKRFRFWEYRKWSKNPQVYFIELTNKAADRSTNLENFIKGAALTFVKRGWIVF